MHRNFHNSRGSFTQTGNPIPRWRIVLIALLLALAVGTAQLPLAQAADPRLSILAQPTALRASVTYRMNPIYPKETLCFGETVTYTVNVYRELENPLPTTLASALQGKNLPELYMRSGVRVEVTSSDTSIGTFAQPGYGHTGEEFDGTNNVEFQFTAKKKLGTTNLYFEAVVDDRDGGGYVTATVPVKVIPCKYEVKTISNFSAQGVQIAAIMEGEMKADEAGDFTGSATVNWIGGSSSFGDCGAAYYDVASSQADLTGKMDDSGQLTAEVNYLGAVITMSGCASASGTMIPDPLKLSVPSYGGVSTQSQNLYEPNFFSFYGSAVIVVIPVEDGAVSFNPHNLAAQVGSPSIWVTELWNNFPWLNNTRLGLYP